MTRVRKYIVIADRAGLHFAQGFVNQLQTQGICYHLLETETAIDSHQVAYLSFQTIGTRIALIATQRHVHTIRATLANIGYGPEEIETFPVETDTLRVFCAHCHNVFNESRTKIVRCLFCRYTLSVTNHYAEYHDAVLGCILCPPEQTNSDEIRGESLCD